MADARTGAKVTAVQVTTTRIEVDTSGFCEHVRFWIRNERTLTYGQDREGTTGYLLVGVPHNSPGALVWKACPIDGVPCDVEQT